MSVKVVRAENQLHGQSLYVHGDVCYHTSKGPGITNGVDCDHLVGDGPGKEFACLTTESIFAIVGPFIDIIVPTTKFRYKFKKRVCGILSSSTCLSLLRRIKMRTQMPALWKWTSQPTWTSFAAGISRGRSAFKTREMLRE